MKKILVSACLLGVPVRYDGQSKPLGSDLLAQWQEEGRLVPFCPEVGGGLPTPRPPAEIERGKTAADILAGQGRVLTQRGEDVTAAFIAGARQAVTLAQQEGCVAAILTERSPSCGRHFVYDGTFEGRTIDGRGITTKALMDAKIPVFPPQELTSVAQHLASGGRTS